MHERVCRTNPCMKKIGIFVDLISSVTVTFYTIFNKNAELVFMELIDQRFDPSDNDHL